MRDILAPFSYPKTSTTHALCPWVQSDLVFPHTAEADRKVAAYHAEDDARDLDVVGHLRQGLAACRVLAPALRLLRLEDRLDVADTAET